MKTSIQIIEANSILGLKQTGVSRAPKALLKAGLDELPNLLSPNVAVQDLNKLYDAKRDPSTHCLNPKAIAQYSRLLSFEVRTAIDRGVFPLLLGGDCSILIGVMHGLKTKGEYGLIFLDAHADYYQPEQSLTGEVADMELGIVTGGKPDLLSAIDGLYPYVLDKNVIHVGQRDQEETRKYGSKEIRESNIHVQDLNEIRANGMAVTVDKIVNQIAELPVNGFWIHFDTDVIEDSLNPAVDYRLNGGLTFDELDKLIKPLLATGNIGGMSITIFNPDLDVNGTIAKQIAQSIRNWFE